MSDVSLTRLNDYIIRNVLSFVSVWDLLHFEATSYGFKKLVDSHFRAVKHFELLSDRISPKTQEANVKKMVVTRFSSELKRLELGYMEDYTWLREVLPLHHPQLFPMTIVGLCADLEPNSEVRRLLDLIIMTNGGSLGNRHTLQLDARNRFELLCDKPLDITLTLDMVRRNKSSVSNPARKLFNHLNSIQDTDTVAKIKKDLSSYEHIALSSPAADAYLDDIKLWFVNVKSLELDPRGIRDVSQVDRVAEKVPITISMDWPNFTNLATFDLIKSHVTRVVFTKTLYDPEPFESLLKAEKLLHVSLSANEFMNDILKHLPVKDEPIQVHLMIPGPVRCDEAVIVPLDLSEHGSKITKITVANATLQEFEKALDHVHLNCPNVKEFSIGSIKGENEDEEEDDDDEEEEDEEEKQAFNKVRIQRIKIMGTRLVSLSPSMSVTLAGLDFIFEHCKNLEEMHLGVECPKETFEDKRLWNNLLRMSTLKKASIDLRQGDVTKGYNVSYSNERIVYKKYDVKPFEALEWKFEYQVQ
ncbi:hypothetical protein HDE_00911 [Halotydeus destructor]|nr:hypothetical protein HDE_00911 [Halotydeus destructor]